MVAWYLLYEAVLEADISKRRFSFHSRLNYHNFRFYFYFPLMFKPKGVQCQEDWQKVTDKEAAKVRVRTDGQNLTIFQQWSDLWSDFLGLVRFW